MRVSPSASTARTAPEPPRGTGGAPGATRVYWQHVDALGSLRGARGGHTPASPRPWTKGRGSQAACAARAPQAGRGSYRPVGLMRRMDEILLSFRLWPFTFR